VYKQIDILREVRNALRRTAKRICYQCEREVPHRDDTSGLSEDGTSRYVHLRSGSMSTSLADGDECQAPEVWREFEAARGTIRVRAYKN
jgi:hypothetical protein